jgi:hypothetical protein
MNGRRRRILEFLELNRRFDRTGNRYVAGGIVHEHVFCRKARYAYPARTKYAPESLKYIALTRIVRPHESANLRQIESDVLDRTEVLYSKFGNPQRIPFALLDADRAQLRPGSVYPLPSGPTMRKQWPQRALIRVPRALRKKQHSSTASE